jgi:CBS-domain-containing membrane protein
MIDAYMSGVQLSSEDGFKQTNKLHGLSPRANYTDRATAESEKWLPTFADKGCHVVSVTDPYGRILGFLDR